MSWSRSAQKASDLSDDAKLLKATRESFYALYQGLITEKSERSRRSWTSSSLGSKVVYLSQWGPTSKVKDRRSRSDSRMRIVRIPSRKISEERRIINSDRQVDLSESSGRS